MAIIQYLGLRVSIVVDGAAAAEYDDPDPTPSEKYPDVEATHKYVESKDDTEYEIEILVQQHFHWLSTHPDNVLVFTPHIDGECHTGIGVTHRMQLRSYAAAITGVTTQPRGADYELLSKFRFNGVTTIDDLDASTVKEDSKRAANMGSIRIEVWRCQQRGRSDLRFRETAEHTNFSIAEKSLKGRAVSHGTSFSTPKRQTARGVMALTYLDKRPLAIFNFKYRSRDALRKEMIVPRTPSPSPEIEGFEGLSRDDVHRLAKERLSELKKENKPAGASQGIKREHAEVYDLTGDDGDGSPVRPPKRERAFVDLTADDDEE